jgi:tetratricopeptide (TPR) repeat protein
MNSKTIAIIAIFIFVCLPAASINAVSSDIEKEFNSSEALHFYESGNDYLKSGRCELAIVEYDKAVELAPDYYGPYSKLGYAHYYCGRFEESLNYFRKALILNRGNVETILGIANVYMVLKQESEARHYFEKVIAMDPDNPGPYMPLALIYNHKKMFVESKALLKTVIKNYPRYTSAYFLLAQNHEFLNEIDSAIESHKEVLRLTPGYAKAYLGLARCYIAKTRYNAAYNCAKAAKRLRSDIIEADDIIRSLKRRFREDKNARETKKASEKQALKRI